MFLLLCAATALQAVAIGDEKEDAVQRLGAYLHEAEHGLPSKYLCEITIVGTSPAGGDVVGETKASMDYFVRKDVWFHAQKIEPSFLEINQDMDDVSRNRAIAALGGFFSENTWTRIRTVGREYAVRFDGTIEDIENPKKPIAYKGLPDDPPMQSMWPSVYPGEPLCFLTAHVADIKDTGTTGNARLRNIHANYTCFEASEKNGVLTGKWRNKFNLTASPGLEYHARFKGDLLVYSAWLEQHLPTLPVIRRGESIIDWAEVDGMDLPKKLVLVYEKDPKAGPWTFEMEYKWSLPGSARFDAVEEEVDNLLDRIKASPKREIAGASLEKEDKDKK